MFSKGPVGSAVTQSLTVKNTFLLLLPRMVLESNWPLCTHEALGVWVHMQV